MEILLTGATGFIGFSLSQYLHSKNHRLTVAIRHTKIDFSDTIRSVIIDNLLAKHGWKTALDNIETVIHLAGLAHINKKSRVCLSEFLKVNKLVTLNLARQAAEAGVKRLIFISSIGVNGKQTFRKPFTAMDEASPTEPYALSKHEAEIGLRQIAVETGMEVVIIRPPLVYGPNAKGNFHQLIHWLNKGIPLPLGAIHNQRSLVALDNLIDLIVTCIDHPAAANQTFLASDDEDLSTTELLQKLGNALGKPARLLPVPQSFLETGLKLVGKGDIAQRLCGNLQVDISKTKQLLNWQPPVTVDNALQKAADAWHQADA